MLALTSHHFVERTPSGEDAWLRKTLLPDDRRVLGALRTGLTVATLLEELSLDPATVEVVLHRLARRGFVRIDLPAAVSAEALPEPLPAPEPQDDAKALSSLLARHAPVVPQEPPPVVDDEPALEPDVDPGSRIYDESPLPVHGSPTQMSSLMEALRHGAASSPEVLPEAMPDRPPPSRPADPAELDKLMRALLRDGQPATSALADLSLPADMARHERRRHREASSRSGSQVSAPRFLRMKDAQVDDPADPAPGLVLPLPSLANRKPAAAQDRAALDAARREHALRKRAEREAAAEARRAEMAARRQAERRQEEGSTLLGMSDRLRRVLEEQKKKG